MYKIDKIKKWNVFYDGFHWTQDMAITWLYVLHWAIIILLKAIKKTISVRNIHLIQNFFLFFWQPKAQRAGVPVAQPVKKAIYNLNWLNEKLQWKSFSILSVGSFGQKIGNSNRIEIWEIYLVDDISVPVPGELFSPNKIIKTKISISIRSSDNHDTF